MGQIVQAVNEITDLLLKSEGGPIKSAECPPRHTEPRTCLSRLKPLSYLQLAQGASGQTRVQGVLRRSRNHAREYF